MLTILLILILVALIALLGVCVWRAMQIPKTPAIDAAPPPVDPARARQYAGKLSEMVKKETISSRFDQDWTKFEAFQESLLPLFPTVFARCEVYHPGGGLVVYLPAQGEVKAEPILLMSHHDVVAATDEGWEHGAFSGDIDDKGRIWGRGTVDTKGSLMCELQALEELLLEGWQPGADVYITSSATEEWSGPCAAEIVAFLKERGVRLGMLLDEGGLLLQEPVQGVRGRYAMVGVVEKGYGDVKLIARSEGGHASAPGRNTPLVRLGSLMRSVEKRSPFRREITPNVRAMFDRMMPNMIFPMKVVFANLWLFAPLLKRFLIHFSPAAAATMQTTCAFTMARGSDGLNVLPAEAYVTANLRFIHHQANEASLEALRRRARRFDVEMEVICQEPPCTIVDHTGAPFRLLEASIAAIFPDYGVVPYVMTGGTDAKFYNDICDHCLRFAPLEVTRQQQASVHTVNENLNADALPPAVDFYRRMLTQWCQGWPEQEAL